MSNDTLTQMLTIVLMVMIFLLFILIVVFCMLKLKNRNKNNSNKDGDYNNTDKSETGTQGDFRQSVFKFMEFDKIEDNMIIQKNGARYLMVVQCQGVNYDLMSSVEKTGVEQGFLSFLNTLRHPIQIYVQTRTINLESSISTYKGKIKEIEDTLNRMKMQYEEMLNSDRFSKEQLDRAYFEITKQKNLYEYGKDVIYNTELMSLNKNILNKNYYIIIPYYPSDLGQNNFDKEEIKNIAFSELYTKAQSIIRTLSACGVNGRILTSDELVELLYVAYNRDESEVFGVDKAMRAGYDELYSTAPDVLDKKMKALDRQIEERAIQEANNAIEKVKSRKEMQIEQKQETMDDIIKEMAKAILAENKKYIGADVAAEASQIIDNTKEEGGKGHVQKETKTRTRRTTRTKKQA